MIDIDRLSPDEIDGIPDMYKFTAKVLIDKYLQLTCDDADLLDMLINGLANEITIQFHNQEPLRIAFNMQIVIGYIYNGRRYKVCVSISSAKRKRLVMNRMVHILGSKCIVLVSTMFRLILTHTNSTTALYTLPNQDNKLE